MNRDMAYDIRTILVYSLYQNLHGIGDTAKDINEWQSRAIDFYRRDPRFHAQVNSVEAQIFGTIDFYAAHPDATYEDRKKHEEKIHEAQLCTAVSLMRLCGEPKI